jgi:hypothetical protein
MQVWFCGCSNKKPTSDSDPSDVRFMHGVLLWLSIQNARSPHTRDSNIITFLFQPLFHLYLRKQYTGDGSDNYAEAARRAAEAGKQAAQASARKAAAAGGEAAAKGAEATANAAAAAVQAGAEGGKAVAGVAVGTAVGGPWGAIMPKWRPGCK